MPVRNAEKAARAEGRKIALPTRKVFRGDAASMYKPDHNPEISTDRGLRRISGGKAKRKSPPVVLVGRGKRPHVDNKGVPGVKVKGQHGDSQSHTKWVPLTKAERRK